MIIAASYYTDQIGPCDTEADASKRDGRCDLCGILIECVISREALQRPQAEIAEFNG